MISKTNLQNTCAWAQWAMHACRNNLTIANTSIKTNTMENNTFCFPSIFFKKIWWGMRFFCFFSIKISKQTQFELVICESFIEIHCTYQDMWNCSWKNKSLGTKGVWRLALQSVEVFWNYERIRANWVQKSLKSKKNIYFLCCQCSWCRRWWETSLFCGVP